MARTILALLGMFFFLGNIVVKRVEAQPIIRLGYTGSGNIASPSEILRAVTLRERLWEKRGLNVRPIYFNSAALMGQAMAAREIDIGDSDVPGLLNVGASGVMDLKVIAITINRLDEVFVVRSSIKTTEDLKGKFVATNRIGGSSYATILMVICSWNLDPDKDVTIRQIGNSSARFAALAANHVQAAVVSSGLVDRLLATGCCRVLADLADLPISYARYGMVAPTFLLKTQRETVRQFLEAVVEGVQVLKSRPEISLELLRQGGVKDPQVAKRFYERVAKALQEYPVPEPKGVQAVLDSLSGPKARMAQAKDFMDISLIEEIKKSGYIDRLYGR